MQNTVRKKAATVLPVLALIAGSIALALPAAAKTAPPPSGPKLYSVELDAVEAGAGALEFTLTFTNLPSSTAVIGSINVTVPSGFTAIGTPVISAISPGRTWTATKAGSLIKLRAASDKKKLGPGEFVAVTFTATPPAGSGGYTFATGAKSSRDFTGSPFFTQVGFNPVLVVCPQTGPCTATLGNTGNAPPGQQTGEVTLDDDCPGCLLTITSTPGNFCTTGDLPANCRSQLVVRFNFIPPYSGGVTLTITCDVNDCPVIEEPPCSECSFFLSSSSDFYPVFFTDSDENSESTYVTEISEFCDSESYIFPPCLDSAGRLEGSNDYQSVVKLDFFSGGDPRVGH
jgi:hypothetical protein